MMKRLAVIAASLLVCSCSLAQRQSSISPFVASRQAEVDRMAEIFYNTRLNDGTWAKHELSDCSAFTHHAFARFDSNPSNGAAASFVAIYDLDHLPAPSMDQPWKGGITFIRTPPHQENRQDAGPSPDYLIAAFNRALKQERAANGSKHPATVPAGQATAMCFVSLSGNTPETPFADDSPANDAPPTPISGILIPLRSSSTMARTQAINFDKDGSILDSSVSLTPK
jgi:hypothetical protein